jgi:hypothetical protein
VVVPDEKGRGHQFSQGGQYGEVDLRGCTCSSRRTCWAWAGASSWDAAGRDGRPHRDKHQRVRADGR